MSFKKVNELKELLVRRRILDVDIERATRAAFPVGSIHDFQRGRAYILAEVKNHSVSADRILILNRATGKEYWIHSFWLINAY